MTRIALTDDQLWILVAFDDAISLGELARRLGCPESTIRMAAKRVRERGWTCSVSYGVCSVCGGTFTRQGHRVGRRAYHPECRPKALKALNTGYDERRWQHMNEDKRQAVLLRAHAFTKSAQAETLVIATTRGARWQAWEDEFILANPDLTTADLARELGRTLYAVTARKQKLRQRNRE